MSGLFGSEDANLVAELTDDRSLLEAERKRRQIERPPKKSHAAVLIKLGNKISNLAAVAGSTPSSWDLDRCLAYLDWAETVVENLPPCHPAALAEFRTTLARSHNVLSDRAK